MGRTREANKPKGKISAYAFFVQQCSAEHKKHHPNEQVVFAEFSKKCAERWKTMTDKEKKKFHDMAKEDKVRYEHEMKDYVPLDGSVRKRGKKLKDPNAPKRALSAFFHFCKDERAKVKAKNPTYGVGDISKNLGGIWSKMTPDDKGPFQRNAQKDRERYAREQALYKGKAIKKPRVVPPPVIQQITPAGAMHDNNEDDDDDEEEEEDDEEEEEEEEEDDE